MSEDFRRLLEAAKVSVREEASGFGNGHSGYMLVGVDMNEVLDWTARYNIANGEEISSLRFIEGNGITVAQFDTQEKYPELSYDLKTAFPDASVYSYGMWDEPDAALDGMYIFGSTDKYTKELDECFAEDGNLRLDVKITDIASGCSFVFGDMLCYGSVEEFENRGDGDEYGYLIKGLSDEEMAKVNEMAEECIKQLRET